MGNKWLFSFVFCIKIKFNDLVLFLTFVSPNENYFLFY